VDLHLKMNLIVLKTLVMSHLLAVLSLLSLCLSFRWGRSFQVAWQPIHREEYRAHSQIQHKGPIHPTVHSVNQYRYTGNMTKKFCIENYNSSSKRCRTQGSVQFYNCKTYSTTNHQRVSFTRWCVKRDHWWLV
jgi:hypothetical protein